MSYFDSPVWSWDQINLSEPVTHKIAYPQIPKNPPFFPNNVAKIDPQVCEGPHPPKPNHTTKVHRETTNVHFEVNSFVSDTYYPLLINHQLDDVTTVWTRLSSQWQVWNLSTPVLHLSPYATHALWCHHFKNYVHLLHSHKHDTHTHALHAHNPCRNTTPYKLKIRLRRALLGMLVLDTVCS